MKVGLATQVGNIIKWSHFRTDLHIEAGPIFLGADCLKFQPIFGLELASSPYYNKIITEADIPICNGLGAKKPS